MLTNFKKIIKIRDLIFIKFGMSIGNALEMRSNGMNKGLKILLDHLCMIMVRNMKSKYEITWL